MKIYEEGRRKQCPAAGDRIPSPGDRNKLGVCKLRRIRRVLPPAKSLNRYSLDRQTAKTPSPSIETPLPKVEKPPPETNPINMSSPPNAMSTFAGAQPPRQGGAGRDGAVLRHLCESYLSGDTTEVASVEDAALLGVKRLQAGKHDTSELFRVYVGDVHYRQTNA